MRVEPVISLPRAKPRQILTSSNLTVKTLLGRRQKLSVISERSVSPSFNQMRSREVEAKNQLELKKSNPLLISSINEKISDET